MRIQNPVKSLTPKKAPIKFFYRILNTPLNYPQELLMLSLLSLLIYLFIVDDKKDNK